MEKVETRKPIAWKPVALDGGYGWVVVLGSFLIHVFADGFVYSFGVLAPSIQEDLEISSAGMGSVLALVTGLMMGTGPIASAICNRYGCRITTIVGAVIASIGCLISSFATSLGYLIVSTGVVMGLGFGLMYCPAIVIVTMYFEKYRSLATGITVCGAGVGTLIFPKIIGLMLENFTEDGGENWRRVFQIYSGVVLLCVPCASLFRAVDFEPIYENVGAEENTAIDANDDKESDDVLIATDEVLITKTKKKAGVDKNALLPNEVNDAEMMELVGKVDNKQARSSNPCPHRCFSLEASNSATIPESRRAIRSNPNLTNLSDCDHRNRKCKHTGYLNVTDCFYPRSITSLNEYKNDPDKFRSLTQTAVPKSSRCNEEPEKMKLVDVESVSSVESGRSDTAESTNIWKTIKKLMDLSLLAQPVFLVFAVANFLISIGFDPPPMFMPIFAEHKNWKGQMSTTTVSIYGLSSIFGRITYGFICDCKLPFYWGKDCPRNRLCIFGVSMIICGLSCCFMFWINSYWILCLYCFFFGFTISSCVCLLSVVLVDLVGVDRLTNAFGLLLFIQGIATFIGPPVAGLLYDQTCEYNWTFAFCGICLLFGGVLLLLILTMQRPQVKEESNQTSNDIHLDKTL